MFWEDGVHGEGPGVPAPKALQLLRSHAVSAPDEVRDEVRSPTSNRLTAGCVMNA